MRGAILFFIIHWCFLIVSSCGVLYDPDNFNSMEGEYVRLYYQSSESDTEKYTVLLNLADLAWIEVRNITGLSMDLKPSIVIVKNEDSLPKLSWSNQYAIDASVHLTDEILYESKECQMGLFRHELTHVIVGSVYGCSESFILTEGIAKYVESKGEYGNIVMPENRKDILSYLGKTYLEIINNYNISAMEEIGFNVHYMYQLAGTFASFWIEYNSIDSYFQLYKGFHCNDVADSFYSVTGMKLGEMYEIFLEYET